MTDKPQQKLDLVTIAFSHYNEKARFALDRYGVPYEERRYLPFLHVFGVLRHVGLPRRRADKVSTQFSTPVMVVRNDHGGGAPTVLADSALILRDIDARAAGGTLYPASHRAEIESFEQLMGTQLGPAVRRSAYFYVLQCSALIRSMYAVGGLPLWQQLFWRVASPLVVLLIRRLLRVNEPAARHDTEKIRRIFADVSARLEQQPEVQPGRRRYLFGTAFSAADLTFSSLAAPILAISAPEGYAANVRYDLIKDEAFHALVRELRATPAGQHALRMFREERLNRKRFDLL